jgi:hypothetical protein
MRAREWAQTAARWTAAGAAAAATVYSAYVSVAWFRYGRVPSPPTGERDALLDGFMPTFEIREHHDIRVAAPADLTLAVARHLDVLDLPVVRALVKGRELIIGATPDRQPRPHALIAEMQSIGWGVLADVPDRMIVMGAVTRPWDANVVFRSVPPGEFVSFHDPGYVKIGWTLRADPIDGGYSIFSTETRAIATDPIARSKFRTYWSFLSPGIILIRMAAVRAVRTEAERQSARLPPPRRAAANDSYRPAPAGPPAFST